MWRMAILTAEAHMAMAHTPATRPAGALTAWVRMALRPYSRWGANTFDVAGRSLLLFGAQALTFRLDYKVHAVSGITFDAWSAGMGIDLQPWAPTEIVFAATAPLEFTWDAWAPCGPGGWQPTAGCEQGGWAAPGACSEGVWDDVRLEELAKMSEHDEDPELWPVEAQRGRRQ